ncbi:MAG: hypothetical protein WCQ50_18890, partial [Spirochaetota bacterium]
MARRVELLEAAALDADDRLLVSAFQGIVNRAAKESSTAALLFIDYGTYDDPSSRRTNSVMMTEEDWLTRFRPFLERNDLDNLDWHRGRHGLEVEKLAGIDEAVARHRDLLSGFVVTDPALPDSINAALVLAGLEGLLVVAPGRESWARELGFERRHDLRGRFRNRVGLYLWAFRELRPRCAEASATCYEPAWGHPESVDLIVKERLFAFGLSSFERGSLRDLGKSLLLFLAAGSWGLRNCVFSLRLDGPLRALALRLLSIGAAETRLFQKVLRSLTRGGGGPYPTLYGWHVDRDDELSFMLLVSACGVRLAPTFMASNFSFHSCLPAKTKLSQAHVDASTVKLERDKVYLTFTLSDGDQC